MKRHISQTSGFELLRPASIGAMIQQILRLLYKTFEFYRKGRNITDCCYKSMTRTCSRRPTTDVRKGRGVLKSKLDILVLVPTFDLLTSRDDYACPQLIFRCTMVASVTPRVAIGGG
jgi:hypothetical protein